MVALHCPQLLSAKHVHPLWLDLIVSLLAAQATVIDTPTKKKIAIELVELTNGNGASDSLTPRNLHKGSHPSLTLLTNRESSGIFSITLALCFLKPSAKMEGSPSCQAFRKWEIDHKVFSHQKDVTGNHREWPGTENINMVVAHRFFRALFPTVDVEVRNDNFVLAILFSNLLSNPILSDGTQQTNVTTGGLLRLSRASLRCFH